MSHPLSIMIHDSLPSTPRSIWLQWPCCQLATGPNTYYVTTNFHLTDFYNYHIDSLLIKGNYDEKRFSFKLSQNTSYMYLYYCTEPYLLTPKIELALSLFFVR